MKRSVLATVLGFTMAAATMLPSFAGMLVVNGSVAKPRVEALTSQIHWNTNLAAAQQQAAREGKMVFWVHMLGSMTGAT
jgi:hypothetical protein